MEGTHKHRGFIRGKFLKSLFRVVKPASSSSSGQFSSKVKPSLYPARVEDLSTNTPVPKQRVSFMKPESITVPDSINGRISSLYSIEGDENVDTKAKNYISFVQERFRNEEEEEDQDWRINNQGNMQHESRPHSSTARMALARPLVVAHYS